jgi:membrane protease YdiL (CAAX protease family)
LNAIPLPGSRFTWFEQPGRDFPFNDGAAVRLSGPQWAFVLAMLALGFVALIAPIPFFETRHGQLVPALLFVALPLCALGHVAPGSATVLFRRLRGSDVAWMGVFAALALMASAALAVVVEHLSTVAENPAAQAVEHMDGADIAWLFARTVPQLIGEELLTILPFLATLSFVHMKLGLPRRTAVLWAGGVSTLLFSAAHLPTYDWNVAQCFFVIGAARVALTLAYVKTKNLWVSVGAHVVMDWTALGATWAAVQAGGAA